MEREGKGAGKAQQQKTALKTSNTEHTVQSARTGTAQSGRIGKTGKIRRAWQWIALRYGVLAEKKYTTIAGTLVFFLILSVVPFAFWLTLLFGKFLVGTEEVLDLEIFSQVRELLLFVQENARAASAGASVVLAVTSLYSASNFFYHLRASGEIIYGCVRKKSGWRSRLAALLLMLATMAVLVAFLAVFVGMVYLLRRFLPVFVADLGGYILLFSLAFGVSAVLNLYLCPYRLHFREAVKGSLITTGFWAAASVGFSIYLHFSRIDKLYGAVTAVIVFLLWAYIMMVCFVVGVVYNEYYARKRREREEMLPYVSAGNDSERVER